MEVLPIKVLVETDIPIFGRLNVDLGQLARVGLPVACGVCVTAPSVKLETVLKHYDFKKREIIEQTLTLIKEEIKKTAVPDIFLKELKGYEKYWVSGIEFKSINNLWIYLLEFWLAQIRTRIWNEGFYRGITEGLESKLVIFTNEPKSFGTAFFDPLQDDVVINVKKEKLHPMDQKKITDIVREANKKLLIPHEYEWIMDKGIKLTGIFNYTFPIPYKVSVAEGVHSACLKGMQEVRCAVKVFTNFSSGLTVETKTDGIFLASEKIFNLENPRGSFEELLLKLVELGITFPDTPILYKLADVKEGMGGVRGALRLLHQKSLLEPILDAVTFALHKKNLKNINLVLPFVRNSQELLDLKRELAVKKLSRRNSLKHWFEIAVPENIINLKDYLLTGVDGIVLNLDELISHISGFDLVKEELAFYKKEVTALISFLEDPVKILHKLKLPTIAIGSLALDHQVLEFLIEKGVYGIVVEKYESYSIKDTLHQMEKRVVLRRSV